METGLVKTQSVLDFLTAEGGEATFVSRNREPGDPHLRRIEIGRALWADLGNPDQITVSIEPGDLLNTKEIENDDSES